MVTIDSGLLQITIEWFSTLKPISGGTDGMDGWMDISTTLRLLRAPYCANKIQHERQYNMINSVLETFIFMENINIVPESLLKSVLVRSWVGMQVRR